MTCPECIEAGATVEESFLIHHEEAVWGGATTYLPEGVDPGPTIGTPVTWPDKGLRAER